MTALSISFTATPRLVNGWAIVELPDTASAKIPTRNMAVAEVTINGTATKVPLEPDGRGSHWFRVGPPLQAAGVVPGKKIDVKLAVTEDWPEPRVAADIKIAFDNDPVTHEMWRKITPRARWEWIRWIRSTNSPDTRAKRIRVAISKMNKGMRRPCCFNQSACTEPAVSKSGILIGA